MQNRRYEILVCQECSSKNVVRADRAKNLNVENYLCEKCNRKKKNQDKFDQALGETRTLIKETHVEGKHRYILVDCASCGQEYWARFDTWDAGLQKCWPCAHPQKQNHGKTNTELYKRWHGMLIRTVYSNEPDKVRVYKKREITVCDEWRRDFEAFERWSLENGFRKELVLDRKDNYKGYSPENCRWVTMQENNKNRRKATYI